MNPIDNQVSPCGSLLSIASHVIVPVHKRALRIVFPRPGVQFVKRLAGGAWATPFQALWPATSCKRGELLGGNLAVNGADLH
jgi:hypothetical protein